MDYSGVIATFKLILNRMDCTDEDAERFLGMGIRRVSRTLRTPLQVATRTLTVDAGFKSFMVPSNFMSAIRVEVDGAGLSRVTPVKLKDYKTGKPEVYSFEAGRIQIGPPPSEGSTIDLTYYRDFEEGHVMGVLADMFTYASLVYAADVYTDARLAQWEQFYQALREEVQQFVDDEARSGETFSVVNPYEGII